MAVDYSKAGQAAADNMPAPGGFVDVPPRKGVAFLRLVEYLEMGTHAPKNPAHKAGRKCRFVFELSHPDHVRGDGDKKFNPKLTFQCNITNSDKGKWKPMFDSMNEAHGGVYAHPAQMIGKEFLGRITHNESGGKIYANLKDDRVEKAEFEDPLTAVVTPVNIPALEGDPRVFLFEPGPGVYSDEEYLAEWDNLFIEGEREDGSSKNWIQNTIIDSIGFNESILAALIANRNCTVVTLDENPLAGI